jgi:glycosyltransferase involved in cell wall biosynthesis
MPPLQIVFFCPPANVINGGIKYIFRMAEALREMGHDAVVLEEQKRRPEWFPSNAPIVGQEALQSNPDQIYVLPEDQTHMLAPLKDWPQQKIIYSQNHFYSAYRLEDLRSYADYGVKHILCSSRTICEHARIRHPGVTAHYVPYSIDTSLFKPAFKHNRIAFMPRKRAIEAAYIRDLFRFTCPQYRDWEWQELSNLGEADIARAMNQANVFLSLSRLEGFGLTPLEAMAAGCVVTGFLGGGGREYATAANGFWAGEDDFPVCIDQLKGALDLAGKEGPARESYAEACRKTLSAYTPETFRQGVKNAWAKILVASG